MEFVNFVLRVGVGMGRAMKKGKKTKSAGQPRKGWGKYAEREGVYTWYKKV